MNKLELNLLKLSEGKSLEFAANYAAIIPQIIEVLKTQNTPECFEQAYSEIYSPIVKRPYPRLENGDYKYIEIDQGWKLWQAASTLIPPEGFILIPAKCFKFFSHDGDNYEVHDTLLEAKHEADCAIEHFRERLADQLSDPRSDGNFQDVGYGLILGHSNYSIDHVVTQDDIDQGNYPYEVGTEILSLYLSEAQEQSHECQNP